MEGRRLIPSGESSLGQHFSQQGLSWLCRPEGPLNS